MLRNPNLAWLSRQHQHALALCVRIDRAGEISESALLAWQEEIQNQFEMEIRHHFGAEERVVFPVAHRFSHLAPLVDGLRADHETLRGYFARAVSRELDVDSLRQFGALLSRHIRTEERELFEELQRKMNPTELDAMGRELSSELEQAVQGCALPRSIVTRPER
jgi:hemerythrin-like domain-containing protein